MRWEIVYQTRESDYGKQVSPDKEWEPEPKSLTDVLEAVRFILLKHRVSKITVKYIGKDSK